MSEATTRRKRILLGQLAARGDCLYATAIARQIKVDYPECHLTWAVGSASRPVLDGNPYIDAIWEIPVAHYGELAPAWAYLRSTAAEMLAKGEVEIGLTFLSEIHDPGVEVVGDLPREISTPTALVGYVSVKSKSPEVAKALLKYLSGPEAEKVYREMGMRAEK